MPAQTAFRPLSVLIIGVAYGLTLATTAAAPESYPLLCVNGGAYLWHVETATDPNNNTTSTVDVPVRHAASMAGSPPAGQCRWKDRLLNADEPNIVRFRWTIGPDGSVIDGYQPGPNGWRDSKLRYTSFSCNVYNDRAGHLIVTKCGD